MPNVKRIKNDGVKSIECSFLELCPLLTKDGGIPSPIKIVYLGWDEPRHGLEDQFHSEGLQYI